MNLSLLLVGLMTSAMPQTTPKENGWFWSNDQAKLSYCIELVPKPYAASLSLPSSERSKTLSISNGGKEIYSVPVHDFSTFTIRDHKIYVAQFNQWTSGCSVDGFNLKTSKPLWTTTLKGLGPIEHSKYNNRVIIRFEGKDLVVYGKEAAGRYKERLDPISGKTLQNILFD